MDNISQKASRETDFFPVKYSISFVFAGPTTTKNNQNSRRARIFVFSCTKCCVCVSLRGITPTPSSSVRSVLLLAVALSAFFVAFCTDRFLAVQVYLLAGRAHGGRADCRTYCRRVRRRFRGVLDVYHKVRQKTAAAAASAVYVVDDVINIDHRVMYKKYVRMSKTLRPFLCFFSLPR